MSNTAYPLDLTGSATTNKVGPEVQVISGSLLIPIAAPFYRNSLTIKIAGGRELHEGLDYYPCLHYQEGSDAAKSSIYGGILLIDRTLTGSIEFTEYQSLGGVSTVTYEEAQKYIAIVDRPDPRNVDWESVMAYPRPIDPVGKPDSLTEAIATCDITKAISLLNEKIVEIKTKEANAFTTIFERIALIGKKISDYRFEDLGPDHDVTYEQLGAIAKDGTVVNALKVYGRTLAELVSFINSVGVDANTLNSYFKLLGGQYQGKLTLTDEGVIIQNKLGTVVVHSVNGNISIVARSGITLQSDTSVNLIGGKNSFSISSTGSAPVYNGFYVIHAGNINQYLAAAGKIINPVLSIKTKDNAQVNLSGDGSAANPLIGYVTLPVASSTIAGLFSLSDNPYNTTDTVPTATAIKSAMSVVDSYTPKTRTINSHSLAGDITISKSDLGLGNVDNTAPEQKVVSTAFQAAVGGKSESNHTHTIDDLINIVVAQSTVKGLSKLEDVLSDSTTTAATARLLSSVYNDATEAVTTVSEKMPKSFFDFLKLSGNIFSHSGFVVTLAGGLTFYAKGIALTTTANVFDLTLLYPNVYRNKTYYAYIEVLTDEEDNATLAYSISTTRTEDTNAKTCLGSFDTNSTGVMSSNIAGFTRVLYLSEVLAHIQSTTAHGLGDINLKDRIGLTDLLNYGVNDTGANTDEYVSLAGINALRGAINNKVIISKGVVANGNYIPLPSGAVLSKCSVFVCVNSITQSSAYAPIKSIQCYATLDANGYLVTCKGITEAGSVLGTANYWIVYTG